MEFIVFTLAFVRHIHYISRLQTDSARLVQRVCRAQSLLCLWRVCRVPMHMLAAVSSRLSLSDLFTRSCGSNEVCCSPITLCRQCWYILLPLQHDVLRTLLRAPIPFGRRCQARQRDLVCFSTGLRECNCSACLRHMACSDPRRAMSQLDVPFSGRVPFSGSSAPAYLAGQTRTNHISSLRGHLQCLIASCQCGSSMKIEHSPVVPFAFLQQDATPRCANAVSKTVKAGLAPRSAEAFFTQILAVCKQAKAPSKLCLQTYCCKSLLS